MKQQEQDEKEEEDEKEEDEEAEGEEEEEDEDEDKEEVLSQSLRKRNKNIQENKAMVMNPFNFLCFPHILIPSVYYSYICPSLVRCPMTLVFSVVVSQLAKLFADLSTMADLTLPTTPPVSIRSSSSFS